jgi:23S rRNA (uracil1939-C5)-methyltransferase
VDESGIQLTGATATLDSAHSRQSRRAWPGTTWGAPGLTYPAAGRSYWLPRGAFFQVNRFLIDRLVSVVTSDRSGPVAWDLYAGVGLFTRALAERFALVVAVEGAEPAAAALATLKAPVTAIHSSTLDFLRARVLDRERPSLIVLDPPRAGLGHEAAQLLNRIGAAEIVYVSCDPTTLALDLAHLTEYEIVTLTLVDLFPQTFHIETITHLKLRPNNSKAKNS